MKDKNTFFVTGGGTGGHIYPAIAVADYLKSDGNAVYYVGNPRNLEYTIVKNYPFLSVNVHALPRKISFDLVFWGVQLIFAIVKSIGYIIKYKPDAVFGTGGYVSAPALFAAKLLNVPFVMHDCDAKPGLVTRKLAPYAAGVSVAFGKAKDYLKNKNIKVNGNPIRSEFKTLDKKTARANMGLEDKLTVCIMGGSQGAKSINNATVEIIKTLVEDNDIQVIFQTGKKNFDSVIDKLAVIYPEYSENKNLIVKPYFEDMINVLKSSDIAVSRAGSLSISELCASSVATIYVPYPHAASDHQRKNARYMEENGAGIYLEDEDVSAETLLDEIMALKNNREKMDAIQIKAHVLAKYDGTSDIVAQIKECI